MSGVEQFDLIEDNQSVISDIEITEDVDDGVDVDDMIDETPDVDQEITEDPQVEDGDDMIDETPDARCLVEGVMGDTVCPPVDEDVSEETQFSNGRMHMEHLNETQRGIFEEAMTQVQNPLFHGLLLHLPMGSGKTRTSLVLGLNLYDQYLIICSKTLIPNWVQEIRKTFGHTFQYEIVHRDYLGASFDCWEPSPHSLVIFTTPETVLRSYKENGIEDHFVELHHQPKKTYYYHLPQGRPFIGRSPEIRGPGLLHCIAWKGIFIDECQNYTNVLTGTCRAIASLYSNHRWLLSGTPLCEAKVERLLGFFLLLNYPRPNCIHEMNQWLKSGTYKGVKEYALSCPPPQINAKLYTIEHCYNMTPPEVLVFAFFKEIIIQWFEYYERLKASLPARSPVLNKVRGHLLSLLTYTRISLVSPKKAIMALMNKIESEPFLHGLNEALEELKPTIEAATDHSSRLKFLYDILAEKIDERVIVFSNFVITLEAAREYLAKQPHIKSRTYYILSNRLTTPQRAAILEQFKADPNGVLFVTYSIGSEGLNLQEASQVIFLDLYWNAAKEQQAAARAYRIGQTRDVTAHYLVSNLQFELSLVEKQIAKSALVRDFMEGSDIINPRLKAGSLSYREMVTLIKKEDIKVLLDSGERFTPKRDGESILTSRSTPSQVDDNSAVGAADADFDDDISEGVADIPSVVGVLEDINLQS